MGVASEYGLLIGWSLGTWMWVDGVQVWGLGFKAGGLRVLKKGRSGLGAS